MLAVVEFVDWGAEIEPRVTIGGLGEKPIPPFIIGCHDRRGGFGAVKDVSPKGSHRQGRCSASLTPPSRSPHSQP
jgi:hypothetical protein